jgi:hypothetical protein
MLNLELTDEEHAALLRLVKHALDSDRFPMSPRRYPLGAILEKLDPRAPREPRPPPKVYAPPKAIAKQTMAGLGRDDAGR